MASAVSSVIIAASQAVAKVYFIGAIGWFSTRFPADRPLLPVAVVPIVARFSFHVLVLSLVFSTTAKSVNVDTIGRYWPLIVGAFFVLAVSYGSASLTATILLRRRNNNKKRGLREQQVDVGALNVAATFPNIVALPILIFPSLCEFEAVSKGYASDRTLEAAELIDRCIAESNTMIFCYFFSWSLAFWTFGYPKLLSSANAFAQRSRDTAGEKSDDPTTEDDSEMVLSDARNVSSMLCTRTDDLGGFVTAGHNLSSIGTFNPPATTTQDSSRSNDDTVGASAATPADARPKPPGLFLALKTTLTSPGFIALALGMIVGCIPKVPDLLFLPGGLLRWLGDGLETLGIASSSLSTMIVAASLAPKQEKSAVGDDVRENDDDNNGRIRAPGKRTVLARMKWLWQTLKSDETAVLTWFILSRLVIAPAIVAGAVVALRCRLSHLFSPLSFLVLIINSCLPGALIVVVLLKSSPDHEESAAAVARVYLPSYLASIITIASWTALGLWITLPDPETGVHPACQ